MPSAFNQRDSVQGHQATRSVRNGEIAVGPETQRLIESGVEPRWGQFLRTWEALAAAKGRYPSRTEIDPSELGAKLLPNVFLVDVVTGEGAKAPRFRFRLLGQAIVDREPTRPGDYLDEIGATAELAIIAQHYRDCMAGKVSVRASSLSWRSERSGCLLYEAMMLPLTDDGETVTHLIGLALYEF